MKNYNAKKFSKTYAYSVDLSNAYPYRCEIRWKIHLDAETYVYVGRLLNIIYIIKWVVGV